MDIAKLGFVIDSSDAVRAAKDLDRLTKAAETAERATGKIRNSGGGNGAGPVPVTGGLRRAAESASPEGGGIEGGLGRAAGGMNKVGLTDVVKMGQEVTGFVKAMQESDDPLMTFIEHGLKIAEVAVSAGGSISQWASAIGLANPVVAGIAAAAAVAVGGFALFHREVAKSAGELTDKMGLTQKQLDDLKAKGVDTTVTMGDTFKAMFKVIGDGLTDGPIGSGIDWLGDKFGKFLDAIVDIATTTWDKIVGNWVGAYNTIVKYWHKFPELILALFLRAVNNAIESVETMINATIKAINWFSEEANKKFHINLPTFDEVQLTKLKAEVGSGVAEVYDYMDAEVAKAQKGSKTAREGLFADVVEEAADIGTKRIKTALKDAAAKGKGSGCNCAAGAARDTGNDNDPFKNLKMVKRDEEPIEVVTFKAPENLELIKDTFVQLPKLIHPVRDQIALIGQDLSKSLGQAIANGENLGDVLSGAFKRIAAEWASKGIQKIFDTLIGEHGSSSTGSLWGTVSSGDLGKIFKGTGDFLSGLFKFDGGGYTGDGSRSGGLDGKGGFLAVMHPRESVIDHTKGGGGAGGQNVHVSVSVTVDDEGRIQAYVRDTSARAVQAGISQYDAAMPQRVDAISNDPRRR